MLSAAIDQNPSAILITDKEGHVEYVNPRVAQLTGYDPDELIGQNLPLWSHDTANDQHLLLWETLKAGREWRGEILGRTKSGDLYWTLETASPLRDSQGEDHPLYGYPARYHGLKSETKRLSRKAKRDSVTWRKWLANGFGSRIRRGVTFTAAQRYKTS